ESTSFESTSEEIIWSLIRIKIFDGITINLQLENINRKKFYFIFYYLIVTSRQYQRFCMYLQVKPKFSDLNGLNYLKQINILNQYDYKIISLFNKNYKFSIIKLIQKIHQMKKQNDYQNQKKNLLIQLFNQLDLDEDQKQRPKHQIQNGKLYQIPETANRQVGKENNTIILNCKRANLQYEFNIYSDEKVGITKHFQKYQLGMQKDNDCDTSFSDYENGIQHCVDDIKKELEAIKKEQTKKMQLKRCQQKESLILIQNFYNFFKVIKPYYYSAKTQSLASFSNYNPNNSNAITQIQL
ncbi:hypothetical protein pb186bvf_002401, partial [Paramecium bursaria]